MTATLFDDTASVAVAGTVVKLDATRAGAFMPTLNVLDSAVIGVALQTIPPHQSGLIVVHGIASVNVVGAVARGDRLITARGVGVARSLPVTVSPAPVSLLGKAISVVKSGQVQVVIQ